MSRNTRGTKTARESSRPLSVFDATETGPQQKGTISFLRQRLWLIGLIGFLSLGVLGAVFKSLENSAAKQRSTNAKSNDVLSKLNPFAMINPTPTPVTLSKEYVYAGSRLLSVVDANAQEVPPADLAIWRPTSGAWWVLDGAANGSYSNSYSIGYGLNGDRPVPGDYDGDGKTDFAIYRNGAWAINQSSTGSDYVVNWGVTADTPVPGDYDGDRKTDIAVFRKDDPSTGYGTFYILRADYSYYSFQFGGSSDKPLSADFDGDGKADIAVWRTSNSTFYWISSINGSVGSFTFTQSSTDPIPADYDGDGKADFAIRESGTSNWIIHNSGSGTTDTISWQNSTDIAVQNDYDGDGKCDIAVWRDATGDWYIRPSANPTATRAVHWGLSGDIPVPAYFRR
jgi:hypothetical protein